MEIIYLDSCVWIQEFFANKKNVSPRSLPQIKKYDPKKVQLVLSQFALLETTNNIIKNEKIKKFCEQEPHLNIIRKQRDINKINITDLEIKKIDSKIEKILFNDVPASVYYKNGSIKNLENLIHFCSRFSISIEDIFHAYFADSCKAKYFVTDDKDLRKSLIRMKKSLGIPYSTISSSKSLHNIEKKYYVKIV